MIDSILSSVWDSLTGWIPPQLLVPQFSGWFWIVVGVVLVSAVLGYFIPMLRSLSGAVSMAAVALIVGMWKGIGYQAAKQQRERPAEKPAPTFRFPF